MFRPGWFLPGCCQEAFNVDISLFEFIDRLYGPLVLLDLLVLVQLDFGY